MSKSDVEALWISAVTGSTSGARAEPSADSRTGIERSEALLGLLLCGRVTGTCVIVGIVAVASSHTVLLLENA